MSTNDEQDDDKEFTDEQLRDALRRVGSEARRAAFAAGRPVVQLKDGKVVWIYPDGTERVAEPTK